MRATEELVIYQEGGRGVDPHTVNEPSSYIGSASNLRSTCQSYNLLLIRQRNYFLFGLIPLIEAFVVD